MTAEYVCIENEKLAKHSEDITELKAKAKFKEQRIEELNEKIDKLTDKVDKLSDNVNKVILASKADDTELELRLISYETQIATLKAELKNQNDQMKNLKESIENDKEASQRQFSNSIKIMGIIFTVITLAVNIYFNMIH